jgi:hypothetical protein
MSAAAALLGCLLAGCSLVLDFEQVFDAGAGTGDAATVADADPVAPDAPVIPDATPPTDGPPPDAAPCVEGVSNAVDPATGHCYMAFAPGGGVDWIAAVDACAALSPPGHLVTISSAEENAIILPLIGGEPWLGANDATTEGVWVWVTGEPFAFQSWASGEPNDGDGGEDCMARRAGGNWDDKDCGGGRDYICERE